MGTSILFCYRATNLNLSYPNRIGVQIQILQRTVGWVPQWKKVRIQVPGEKRIPVSLGEKISSVAIQAPTTRESSASLPAQ